MLLNNLYLNVEFKRRFSGPKEHRLRSNSVFDMHPLESNYRNTRYIFIILRPRNSFVPYSWFLLSPPLLPRCLNRFPRYSCVTWSFWRRTKCEPFWTAKSYFRCAKKWSRIHYAQNSLILKFKYSYQPVHAIQISCHGHFKCVFFGWCQQPARRLVSLCCRAPDCCAEGRRFKPQTRLDQTKPALKALK